MALITPADLNTHLYSEIIAEITRSNATITTKAIAAAEAEVKGYLGRFDLDQLFGTADAEPTVNDENLKSKIKDVACWHLVRLANPNVSMELFRTLYEDAIKFFEKVALGRWDPPGWPYLPADPTNSDGSLPGVSAVYGSSNRKRHNHF